jgi:hypothetical protein
MGHTPSAICALLFLWFSSSLWLKIWSSPGGKLTFAYQSLLLYGDLAALMRINTSGESVRRVFGPMREIVPVCVSNFLIEHITGKRLPYFLQVFARMIG